MLTHNHLARLCAARKQLQQVGTDEQSIGEIASSAAISRFHFVRQIKAVFGHTPARIRSRARIELAKRYLAETDLPITEICLLVGFSSLGSFSRLFSKEIGQSPSAYRKSIQGGHALAMPGCMQLLQEAWQTKPQISRSSRITD